MGFNKILWGFIFLFDFRINGFDILPDFIGYILIFLGLKMLAERNENFNKAKLLALPLIFLSLLDIYQTQDNAQVVSHSFFVEIIGIAFMVISLIMVYRICLGISEMAGMKSDTELEIKAMQRWKIYLISEILLLSVIIIPSFFALLFFPIVIFSFVAYILILLLLKDAERRLDLHQ